MDTLSEQDRIIVYMRYVLLAPTEEIGARMKLSRHAIDTRLWRARKALQHAIPEYEEGENMATTKGTRVTYSCSFCAKSQDQVKRLIAGPGGIYICDECVDLCREIIQEEQPSTKPHVAASDMPALQQEEGVRAFFAGLPTDNDPLQTGTPYPTVHIEFTGQPHQGPLPKFFLVGQDSTGIVARATSGMDTTIHFYPWSSIFSLTS